MSLTAHDVKDNGRKIELGKTLADCHAQLQKGEIAVFVKNSMVGEIAGKIIEKDNHDRFLHGHEVPDLIGVYAVSRSLI